MKKKAVKYSFFVSEELSEKEELIERALRLARQAQETALKSASSNNRKQAWNRPSSTPGRFELVCKAVLVIAG